MKSTGRPKNLQKKTKKARDRKMLIKCSKNMNSDEYVKVLQKYQENLTFDALLYQQDNAPIHKAKKIMDYFAENCRKILDWPAYSHDLNPFENLWAINKERLPKKTVSWESLDEKILAIWNNFDQETVAKLCESMENRIEKIFRVKGSRIGY